MKKCPFCGEDIQETDVKCTHCEELLPKLGQYSVNNDQEIKPKAKSINETVTTTPPSKQAAPPSPAQTMTASQPTAQSPALLAKTVVCTNPACSQKYEVAVERLGKKVRCSKCNTVFIATEDQEEPELLTLADSYEETVIVSQNQGKKTSPAKAIAVDPVILSPKKSTPQQKETASLPTRWLSLYNYGLLPFWAFMALIMAVGFFQYNFIFSALNLTYVILIGVLIYGLHKRFFWAWQCNWIVLAAIIFTPGISKISLGGYIVAIILKACLFTALFFIYFKKRRSLFLHGISPLKNNIIIAFFSLFFLCIAIDNIYSVATGKYVGTLDFLKKADAVANTAPLPEAKPQYETLPAAEPATAPAYVTSSVPAATTHGDSRFVVVNEGIIEDTVTGIMWEQNQTSRVMGWGGAMSYAESLYFGGYGGWRLPTKEELEGLIDYAKSKGIKENFNLFYNNLGFNGWMASGYWSSSTYTSSNSPAMLINFHNGITSHVRKDYDYYVRVVRNGKAPAPAPASVASSVPPATEPKQAPEYVEWKKKNSWYGSDREKTAIADKVAETNRGLPLVKVLELVDNRIAEVYGATNAGHKTANGDGRFRQVGKEILQDTKTGLMWEQAGSLPGTNWDGANAYAQSCNLGGYHDWRLPTKEEWEELLTYANNQGITQNKESFFDASGFKNTVSSYWSSSTSTNRTDNAWYVYFNYANGGGLSEHSKAFYGHSVRAVRGGHQGQTHVKQPTTPSSNGSRFMQTGNGILKDTKSGLMWEQAGSSRETSWASANNYAQSLTLGGYHDWRLPTKEEWEELVSYAKTQGVSNNMGNFFDKQGFKNTIDKYWSSTADPGSTGYALCVDFFYGNVGNRGKGEGAIYIRAVRSELSPSKLSPRRNSAIETHYNRGVR